MEVIGYTWLSASLIFIGLLFKGGKIETAIKWIFIVNGILGVIAPIQAGYTPRFLAVLTH
jgi:hypothetical protein